MRALRNAMIHGPARLVAAALLLAVACAPAQPKPSVSSAPAGGDAAAGSGAAAGASQASGQSSGPKRVTEVLGSEVISISPYGDSASPTYGMWMHVFEPLIWFSEATSQNEPLLATTWSNPDPNTWVFNLRRDVKFHDGSDFTADDVVHSYKRMRDGPTSQQRST